MLPTTTLAKDLHNFFRVASHSHLTTKQKHFMLLGGEFYLLFILSHKIGVSGQKSLGEQAKTLAISFRWLILYLALRFEDST